MVWGVTRSRRPHGRNGRHPIRPTFDSLEARRMLNASTSSQLVVDSLGIHDQGTVQPVLGTITGRVTNEATGRGINNVKVQLIGANGIVVRTTLTHAGGQYRFKISQNAPYVVHVITPKRFTQVTPTFVTTKPTGSYATNPATGVPYGLSSWNYHTGNNNPANGPVGPAAWATIAPAGTLPFESPINITGPTINLSQYLTINYSNSVPRAIVNNGGYPVEVTFPSNAPDTITLGGQQYSLTQFHYHDTAENQVNGYTYPMEEHFVNVSASGAETVVAVFLQLGAYNPALQTVLSAASADLTTPNSTTTISTPIDFAGLLPTNPQGWYYQGSLTTPPLSQPINWLVFATPITLDYQQLQEYEAEAGGLGMLPNNRPVQPTDGRQTNEFNYDVNFQGQNVSGLNFGLAPAMGPFSASELRAMSTPGNSNTNSNNTISTLALPVLQPATSGTNTLAAVTGRTPGLMPVPGCNCPLCQMLRNAVWHQVLPQTGPTASAVPTVVNTTPAATL